MPLVEVKVFEDELTPEQTKDLIQKITDAVTTVVSPKIRDAVWVVVHEIKSGNWGVGGKVLGVTDVRKVIDGRKLGTRLQMARCDVHRGGSVQFARNALGVAPHNSAQPNNFKQSN